jgi:hypothetical protein
MLSGSIVTYDIMGSSSSSSSVTPGDLQVNKKKVLEILQVTIEILSQRKKEKKNIVFHANRVKLYSKVRNLHGN